MKQKYECGKLIKQIHDNLEKQANNALSSQNLTLTQMRVLMELEAIDEKQLTLKELESILHVAQSTVAGIVVRLEQKGYVKSFVDSNDRRIKRVFITTLGMKCCENAQIHIKNMEEQLLSELNESERIYFYNLLLKICK